jgi:hypothetical protein
MDGRLRVALGATGMRQGSPAIVSTGCTKLPVQALFSLYPTLAGAAHPFDPLSARRLVSFPTLHLLFVIVSSPLLAID